MHIMVIADAIYECDQAPEHLNENEFLWLTCTQQELESKEQQIQTILAQFNEQPLLDLHMKDLLSTQELSHYDYTSSYDVIIFRHLDTSCLSTTEAAPPLAAQMPEKVKPVPVIAPDIRTQSVGFIVYDRILLSVFDEQDPSLKQLQQKLLDNKTSMAGRVRHTSAHLPSSPDELLLHLVDTLLGSYANLRHDLSQKLEHWQSALMNSEKSIPPEHWGALFKTRNLLYLLDDLYEDQSVTMRAWQESVENDSSSPSIELLAVRSRDVIEHIERAQSYVNRLQTALESAIQIHFSATANQTNQVVRILTVITAIFLPLNLLTGLFGMNFEGMFLTQYSWGFWLVLALMVLNTAALVRYFWRKKYLK